MNESAVYNEADLAPFHKRLSVLRQIIQQDAESNKHPKAITKLLERQVNEAGSYTFINSVLFNLNSNRCCRKATAGILISLVS